MYVAELLLDNTHYHCSKLLVRMRHLWLARTLEPSTINRTLALAARLSTLLDARDILRGKGSIRLKSLEDARRLFEAELDDKLTSLLIEYARSVGYTNIVQFLASKHPLLLVYSATLGCYRPDVNCVLEPRIEVDNHDTLRELERERMLPYRLFDILVEEKEHIRMIELKYILSARANPRQTVPGGTLLAHLASFVEKLVSTMQLAQKLLQEAGYKVKYHLIIILGPGRRIEQNTWRHVETITREISSLTSTPIEAHYIPYEKLAQNATPAVPVDDRVFEHQRTAKPAPAPPGAK